MPDQQRGKHRALQKRVTGGWAHNLQHLELPQTVAEQVTWALQQIEQRGQALLEEAQYGAAAQQLEPSMVQTALQAIRTHLEQQGDLRGQAMTENLIAP
jgi:hypothetical protein